MVRLLVLLLCLVPLGCGAGGSDSSESTPDDKKQGKQPSAGNEEAARYLRMRGEWKAAKEGQKYVGFIVTEPANYWSDPASRHPPEIVERMKGTQAIILRIDAGVGTAGETAGYLFKGDTLVILAAG
jgi:hypothetical protein